MDERWQPHLIRAINQQLRAPLKEIFSAGKCHLVMLVEPYLTRLLDGTKTVESRFSRQRRPPFGIVEAGDTLILKRSSGSVLGLCTVAQVYYFDLARINLQTIQKRFGRAISADEKFWRDQRQARFVSLFRVEHVVRLSEITCHKRDRRAWVVMKEKLCAEAQPSHNPSTDQARNLIRHQFAVCLNPSRASVGRR